MFNDEYYRSIAIHKTSYYTFILPVKLALYLCFGKNLGGYDLDLENTLKDIGVLFQISDDVNGFYNSEKVNGKSNTDAKERKCTWLLIQALKSLTSSRTSDFKVIELKIMNIIKKN